MASCSLLACVDTRTNATSTTAPDTHTHAQVAPLFKSNAHKTAHPNRRETSFLPRHLPARATMLASAPSLRAGAAPARRSLQAAAAGPSPLRAAPARRSLKAAAGPASAAAPASAYRPPSSATGATELDYVAARSHVVPDTLLFSTGEGGGRPEAATVSAAVLNAALASATLTSAARPWAQAVAAGVAYDRCLGLSDPAARAACQLDKVLANVAALAAEGVAGRVAVELDPRLSGDSAALVARADALLALLDEARVPRAKLVLRVPATWAGLQACRALEARGVATQAYLVFSLVQAAAATQAGVSVISPNVGRTRDFYLKFPNAVKDAAGPREDAGGASLFSAADPGVALARRVYTYAKKFGGAEAGFPAPPLVMASGLRSRADVLAVAGCDFVVVPAGVLAQLEAASTVSGYNDGLSAAGGPGDDERLPGGASLRPLTPELAAADEAVEELPPLTEAAFEDGLGMAGGALLSAGLSGMCYEADRLARTLRDMVAGE